jgi:predicted thioesterase
MDCHSICTAIAAAYRQEGREIGTEPYIWYATGSLQVEYLKPTPIGEPLTILAKVKEITGRRTVLDCSLLARGEECARGEVVAVRIPPDWHSSRLQGAART